MILEVFFNPNDSVTLWLYKAQVLETMTRFVSNILKNIAKQEGGWYSHPTASCNNTESICVYLNPCSNKIEPTGSGFQVFLWVSQANPWIIICSKQKADTLLSQAVKITEKHTLTDKSGAVVAMVLMQSDPWENAHRSRGANNVFVVLQERGN